ncbi:hypothetical protein LX64_03062 [Chitinophaga skermanii]|uniref:GLPGLI family protein n=1 Tax=Chitinophaga skermanii TaxID=331697 RepID=A0A327QKF3_9BACT|nr:hypothetical protein [Chitinophaga skermanii]RAJ04184.1 hypothetical protein LX64_03062 [Chitinophaga skermanii]
MFTRKLIWAMVAMLTSATAFAQKYEKGVIYTAKGDSLTGFIEKKLLSTNSPEAIHFKSSKEGEVVTYLPTMVKGFKYTDLNETFISQELTLDLTSQKLEDLKNRAQQTRDIQKKTVFIQLLLEGQTKLYVYNWGNNIDYFILQDEVKQFYPLDNLVEYEGVRRFSNQQSQQELLTTIPVYKGALKRVFNTCVSDKQLKPVRYTKKSLVEIIKKYEACQYGKDALRSIVEY